MGPEKIFAGKVAVVTGAGQGIGFEICRQLALQGARVLLNDSDEDMAIVAAERIAEEVKTAGDGQNSCVALAGDAADLSFIHRMIDVAVANWGRLDIVIANAGITLFGDFLSYPPESFFRVMQ